MVSALHLLRPPRVAVVCLALAFSAGAGDGQEAAAAPAAAQLASPTATVRTDEPTAAEAGQAAPDTATPTPAASEPPDPSPTAAPAATATAAPEPATATVASEPTGAPSESNATPTASAETAEPSATPTASAAAPATSTRVRPSRTPSPTPTRTAGASPAPAPVYPWLPAAGGAALTGPLASFAAGALAVFIGVLLGAASAALPRRRRVRRARAATATAMLAELRWVDAVLRKIADRGAASADLSLEHPIIEAGLRTFGLFDAETTGRIADLRYHLLGLAAEIHRYRENPKAWVGRMPELDRSLRQKAVAACRAVPELGKALRGHGGTLAAPAPGGEAGGDDALPPTPFAAGDGDEWTL